MSRRLHLYKDLLGISRNPFPANAIADQGNMAAFDPRVHLDLPERMAQVFLGPHRRTGRRVRFLWSLGAGVEARGYGKSAYLMWMAQEINSDFGNSFLRLCGGDDSNSDKVVAFYAGFSTVDALSLSGVLYRATRDLLCGGHDVLRRLKDDWLGMGKDARTLYTQAGTLASSATITTDGWMLRELVFSDLSDWRRFFDRHSIWHCQRWGQRLFATVTACLKVLGVNRILLLVDQVEDFAGNAPPWRHYRDFGRMASMCADDPLFSDGLQIVLAQHPGAQRVMQRCWVEEKLGPLPSHTDATRCIIIPPMDVNGMVRLTARYLSKVRVTPATGVTPFTRDALRRVCELAKGRPGEAIEKLRNLIETAVDSRCALVDLKLVEDLFP